MQTRHAIERLVLVFGVSLVLSSLVLLLTVLLPGPFTEQPVLLALNLVTIVGLLTHLVKLRTNYTTDEDSPSSVEWPSRSVLLILLAIVVAAAFTRFTRLGYAEFHEDELENMRLIVRAYKGEEYAPFIDSKGPIHWLLPAALWYANGWINEGIARAPFAWASLFLIPGMYILGRRMSAGRDSIGLIAASFVALNGFFVALARHVENRSLIVFLGALAVWFAYRYYKENLSLFLLYLAVTLAVALIAHPTVLLYLPAVGYIIGLKLWRDGLKQTGRLWLGVGAVTFAGILALFYIPYFTSPEIERVYEYFANERVGTSFLYNRVENMLGEDELYSSRFHMPVLLLLLAWLLARNFARAGWWGWGTFIGLGLAIISTVAIPEAWIAGDFNLAFVPYLLLTLLLIGLPQTSFEIKAAFLWFSAPFGALLFLATDASNHIQIAYTGWALLCAFALDDLWSILSRNSSSILPEEPVARAAGFKSAVKAFIVVAFVAIIPLIVFYEYLSFGAPVTTYWNAKIDYTYNPHSIYNYVYGSIARPRRAISNPRLGGWKAVGYLWETGQISGDFRSINESFAVPIWYTFQTPRSCYTDPKNYWLRRDWKGWPEEETSLLENGYSLTRVVLVDGQPKLHLYEKNAWLQEPELLPVDAFRRSFDRLATPSRFAQGDTYNHPTSLNFGDKLLLRGYDLPPTAGAGELLPVTVYWEGLSPMDIRYRAFVHLVDQTGARWGQHDDDPACRLLTTEMHPSQQASRQFRLPVDPATPPGAYQVVLGVYEPDTFTRLDIWDNSAQQSPGSSIVLGEVSIR